jgi:hypothetical protein
MLALSARSPLGSYYTVIKYKECVEGIFRWTWSDHTRSALRRVDSGGDFAPDVFFENTMSGYDFRPFINAHYEEFEAAHGGPENVIPDWEDTQ